MVKIRLSRGGAKSRPFYHIVVADERSGRDGRNIERLGFYNPVAAGQETPLEVRLDRVDHWLGVGAQMTDSPARRQARKQKPWAAEDGSEEAAA